MARHMGVAESFWSDIVQIRQHVPRVACARLRLGDGAERGAAERLLFAPGGGQGLGDGALGVLVSASLAVHAIGQGLAQALGKLSKHGVKQVDRLLSNQGIDVWEFFGYWIPYLVGARTEVVVAMDWTSFARDQQDTVVLSMLTGHGRATPLMWMTVRSSALKGQMKRYEKESLERLREVMPLGVKVTVVADRGFGDCKLFKALTQELGFEYVIRIRGDSRGCGTHGRSCTPVGRDAVPASR